MPLTPRIGTPRWGMCFSRALRLSHRPKRMMPQVAEAAAAVLSRARYFGCCFASG